ncbi:ABC transporter substrate-binding protein [Anaerotruncus colihominis]|uniref:ABC transporter substrate-binding protein n=1 Tax=Anaerotruncus colihominis TaxID=169435 RepID=UPI0039952DCA
MKRILSAILSVAMAASLAACGSSQSQSSAPADAPAPSAPAESAADAPDDKLTFGLVVMSTNSDYWLTLKDGAQEAVDAIGGELVFTGPADNNDIQGQVSLMENLINSKVDAILLTPLDSDALAAPVEKAMDAGIPVIVIDSAVNTDKYTSFIATDNVAGGRMAMERLIESIGGSGEVVVVNALAGIPSNDARGQGAEEYAAAVDGVTVLPQQHCLDQAEAMTATENVIIGNPNLKGIFATFNRGALGAAQAIVSKGKAGEIKMVAFDADADEIKLLEDGTIDALVVQQPYEMGKIGIEYAVKALNGEEVPKTVAPEVVIATKDNMNDEAVHKVLYPKG